MSNDAEELLATEEQINEMLAAQLREREAQEDTIRMDSSSPAIPDTAAPTSSSGETNAPFLSPQKLVSLGVLSPVQVDRICAEQTRTQFLVEDLLPVKSIAIAGGESTIGKSALICQLGLCVATGEQFLGMKTKKGRVLYFDLENSILDCRTMRNSLLQHLNLKEPPDNFLLVPEPQTNLNYLLDSVKPALVVIDSLRSFRPDVTEKNREAGEWLKEIRSLTRKHDCSFLIVHHLRKSSRDNPWTVNLETCGVATWSQDMEGPRAFINQTDVRIAIAEGDGNPAALQLKWALRVRGDSPLVLVERMFDDDGEPIGYQHLTGVDLLSQEKRRVIERLPEEPEEFSTAQVKEARKACELGAGNDPTNKFLAECKQMRIIEKVGRGRWRKSKA